ncbi:MAG: sigma-70 family RNA polymerase sigma factor [Terriglobales bacterium]
MRPELVQAYQLLRSNDPKSVEEALRLIQSTVFSFSMKVCGHREDAEDTMQDVLLKSLPHLQKIENPQALAVWLYKVTRNHCWMSRRKSKFAPDQTLSLEELMPDSAELESLTGHSEQSPEAKAVSKQQAERVHEAVLRIPPKYRLVLVLHDMEDLDTSDVAKITGLSEGTVRVRLHRARLFVRRELAGRTTAKVSRRRRASKPADCRKMFASLSEYIDGRLDRLTCDRIRKHLQDCPSCIAFINDLNRAIERCRSYEVQCGPQIAAQLRQLLLQEYFRFSRPREDSTATSRACS